MFSRAKTPQEIEAMRQAGGILATVLDLLVQRTQDGMTATDLSQLAHRELLALGGQPAFLGVPHPHGGEPFPDVICISINEEVQHGIPKKRRIHDGDIVNLDLGVTYQGMITDAGLTFGVGRIDRQAQHLLENTQRALSAGLKAVKAGATVKHISTAIEEVLKRAKLGIVRELVGHGVGHELHEEPEIPNYASAASDYVLCENQTIAVEPIATLGNGRIKLSADGWTLVSTDGCLAAHFEHTVRVTPLGCEILTQLPLSE